MNKIQKNTVVILAGGFGTRLSEETATKPKPMVEIGSKPILWHIIKHYQYYGFKNFVICLGYKGKFIEKYFKLHSNLFSDLNIKLLSTGLNSLTATRIFKVRNHLTNTFLLTYGDAVSNINLNKLMLFHKRKNSLFTISGVIPKSRYGSIKFNKNSLITKFREKKDFETNLISGGYFVVDKRVFKYISKKNEMLEEKPFRRIQKTKKMFVFKHYGFWQCMDTLRDKVLLEKLWKTNPLWKIWK
jgi:glucose-1-phosphate cytidylyltransferase